MKVVLKKKEDKKKVWTLGALGVVAAYLFYANVLSSDSSSSAPSGSTAAANTAAPGDTFRPLGTRRRGITAGREWIPTQGPRRPEDRVDPSKVDPTLKLDLLAKVQNVPLEGGARNLFQFGAAAPPPDTKPLPNVGKIAINKPPSGLTPTAPPPGPPPVPPPPPIPLKYYGYSNARGETRKKAFFLDGEDIIVAWEGDMVKNRYKVVHVGVNSVEMEDTQSKNKQTLPLAEEAVG